MCQIHGLREVTFRMGENETEADMVLIKKEHQRYTQNVTAIPGKFQHAIVVADIDKRKIRKVVRKTCTERCEDKFAERRKTYAVRRKISVLKEER